MDPLPSKKTVHLPAKKMVAMSVTELVDSHVKRISLMTAQNPVLPTTTMILKAAISVTAVGLRNAMESDLDEDEKLKRNAMITELGKMAGEAAKAQAAEAQAAEAQPAKGGGKRRRRKSKKRKSKTRKYTKKRKSKKKKTRRRRTRR